MPKNEDGEFELILGNKQLLSMFFVVVILLGVFFVMGYIVGRNSAPLGGVDTASHKPSEAKPLVVDSPAKQAPPETETTPPPVVATAPQLPEKPKEKTPEPVQTAKVEPPKSEPTKPAPAPKREPKAEPDQVKATKARPAAQSNAPVAGGTYLQLVATTKHDADATVDALRKSNFQALDDEVPEKPGLFRVLVGPVPAGEYNKLKADLQAKGFPGNGAFKKTF